MKYSDKVCQRIYDIAIKDLDEIKYLYSNIVIGCLSHVFRYARVPTKNPIPEEYLETFIDALHDSFYGGCEPEFETDEEYDKYTEALRRIREDLVWSTPKYSKDLNNFLFPNGCDVVPAICEIQYITNRIERLNEEQNNTFSRDYWGEKHKTFKEMYNEFWGNQ